MTIKRTSRGKGRRPRHIVIYEIKCQISGKYYIGSSRDVCMRWNSHIWDIITDKHVCKALREETNKHGITSLTFRVIRMLDRGISSKLLREIEQGYMNSYPQEALLNTNRASRKPKT